MERTPSMESARVDLRKLQLLNDRINQCLDALNQVRLSTHGLSHTAAQSANPGYPSPGYNVGYSAQGPQFSGLPMGTNPQIGGIGQGIDPRFAGAIPFQGQAAGYYGGLSHTPFAGIPQYGLNPIAQTSGLGGAQWPFAGQFAGQNPLAAFMPGLSHTGAELETGYQRPIWADPILAARVRETFPFVQYPLPPVVSVY